MAGLYDKARIVVLSSAHGLMDRVIDLNSIGAVRQYVRDVEDALDNLQDAAAIARGHVTSVARERDQLGAQTAELNGNIDFILGDNKPENDHLAQPLEGRLMGLEQRLETTKTELTAAETTARALNEAASALKVKHQTMVGQLQRLEAMDRATRAKEQAANAMKQAGRSMSKGSDVSVDDVTERMQRNADVADARFNRAMGDMVDQVDKDVTMAQAEARLAARKARLTGGTTPTTTPATTPDTNTTTE